MVMELCWDYYNGVYYREVRRSISTRVSKTKSSKNGTIVTKENTIHSNGESPKIGTMATKKVEKLG